MIRLGLCCVFKQAPIKFRQTTARHVGGMNEEDRRQFLSGICRDNANALSKALAFCRDNGIGAFRVNSRILPLKTHPALGYDLTDLPEGDAIVRQFQACGDFCRRHQIRTSFHPDQFVLLSAQTDDIIESSKKELRYQAEVSDWIGADVINIHGGGAYGDKKTSLKRLVREITGLPEAVISRLTLENDDRTYTPADLLPVCRETGLGFVYDVHHHRCLGDGLSITEATEAALGTWNREPLFHLSSPVNGWGVRDVRPHHDLIDPADFPDTWDRLTVTVEMEAKDKELAIAKFRKDMEHRLVFR